MGLTSRAAIRDLISGVQNAAWNGYEEMDRAAAEAVEQIADALGLCKCEKCVPTDSFQDHAD